MRGAAGVTLGMVQGAAPAAPCSAARKAVRISSAVSQLERATPAALGRAPWLLLTAGTTASGVPPPPFCLQAPGRLLVPADIGPGLVGRHAELFWPDSNQWFPIVVQARHTPRCAGAPVAQGCRRILVLLLKSVCGGGGSTHHHYHHPPTHPPPRLGPLAAQSFDPVARTAAIMYTGTGEAETLRMDDIVKEGHMSLLLHQPGQR